MTELGLSIGFAAGAASAGRRWLRIEQVRADSQAATLADAARLIDALFDTDPCDQGTEGTGGASAKEPPSEDDFSEAVEKTIDLKQLCDDCEYWETAVDVFRSHQSPDFRLVSETAEIGNQREMVSEAKTETFQLSGASSVDLSWPYHSGLRVSGATVAGVSGSTVVFGAPVYGSVQVIYQSLWQRVTVRVPAVPADNGVRQAEPAAVVCFWADLAAACDLVQPENEDEVNDPEYYKRRCCVYPPRPLPRCRETRARWSPGAEIDGGAAHYQDIYGPGVQLTAVSPEQGDCGEKIWSWDTSAKNCCDDIIPLSPSPQNPEEFHAGESHWIEVLDGRPGELRWTFGGGLYVYDDYGLKTHSYKTVSRIVLVYAEREGLCPTPRIRVDDGCKPVQMVFQGGGATPPSLPDDLVAAPEQRFYVSVSGGVPPYRWQSGGQIRLLSWDNEDGATALFEASSDFCGTEEITVVDACGESDTLPVRSTDGRWEEVTDFDPCQAPWGGRAPASSLSDSRCLHTAYSVDGYQGYRAIVCTASGQADMTQPGGGCPHNGDCAAAIAAITDQSYVPCGYTGRELIYDAYTGLSAFYCQEQGTADNGVQCYPLCKNVYACYKYSSGDEEGQNQWAAQSQHIVQLWRWVCGEVSV